MFGKEFQRKFALTELGVHNTKMGTLWTVIVNLVVMGGMGILYLMMNGFIDTLTEGKPLPGVLTILLLVLGFLILSFFTHLQQYKSTYGLVYREVKNVRISLAERLRKLPLGYFGKRDLADLTETIMGDVNRLEHVWSHCLGYLYGSYISTAVIAVMLFAYNWKNSEITKAAAVQVSDGIQETLENIREIRATNQEDRFLKALNDKIDYHESRMIHTELTNGIFVNAASVIMRLGVATTILAGTGMILSGEISFMVLFMFLLVITRVYAPFDQALALIAEMFLSQVSADRLMEIHDAKTAEGSESFSPEGHDIVFENVGFAYNVNSGEAGREGPLGGDNEQVLKGVSSGSGKSTCARLAARLWDIDSGTIRVGGVNISDIEPETLLTDYSMVFQDVVLFDDTVMENIRLGKHGATDEEVRAAAKAANCDEFVEKLPQGYDTPIGENGARLSGGERQRISIARALLKDAPIVLLDEATASLDVENETKVQGALSHLLTGKTVLVIAHRMRTHLLTGKTVLVIAHRMRTVEAADKIVVLKDGKVAEEGSPEELFAREGGMFRRMTELQAASAGWTI